MNCNCIETINRRLKKENLELDTLLVFGSMISTLFIPTQWKDESEKPRGKKPTKIVVIYCPFCGKKAE